MEAKGRPRDVGKKINMKKSDFHRNVGFPIVKTMFLKVRTSILECQVARNRSNIGKKVAEGDSGKQDEFKNEQERRKSEPRAAEKRPKSPEMHVGDA